MDSPSGRDIPEQVRCPCNKAGSAVASPITHSIISPVVPSRRVNARGICPDQERIEIDGSVDSPDPFPPAVTLQVISLVAFRKASA